MLESNETWRFIISSVGKDVEKGHSRSRLVGGQSGSTCQNKHYPQTLRIITLLDTFPIKYAHK